MTNSGQVARPIVGIVSGGEQMGHSNFYLDDEDLPLMTEKEFSRAVGLAEISIRKKRSKGLIPHFRFGRAVRYSRAQLEEFLSQAYRPTVKSASQPVGSYPSASQAQR